MPPETKQGKNKEVPAEFELGGAYISKGKWHCECKSLARCRTTRRLGPNLGRKFWTCVNPEGQCTFFLWVDDEAAAKESLRVKAVLDPRPPQTPGSNSKDPGASTVPDVEAQRSVPGILETPFTKAKRKAPRRDISVQDTELDGSESGMIGMDDPFTGPTESGRKAAKKTAISTPSQIFAERLKSSIECLPTPQTRDPSFVPAAAALETRDSSPTPTQRNGTKTALPKEGRAKGETNLTTTVLDLIRADSLRLKGSTEMQIRHEINLALALAATRVQSHEATISELKNKVDELENLVLLLM